MDLVAIVGQATLETPVFSVPYLLLPWHQSFMGCLVFWYAIHAPKLNPALDPTKGIIFPIAWPKPASGKILETSMVLMLLGGLLSESAEKKCFGVGTVLKM